MSDIKHREQLRDNIASMLELSRASWRLNHQADELEENEEKPFPRSMVFKTVGKHPLLSAAMAVSVWYFGPAKFGAMAVAGASLFMRHRLSILPIAQQIISTNLFRSKTGRREP